MVVSIAVKAWSIAVVILCTLFTSVGQLLWKLGVGSGFELSVTGIATNWMLLLGFVLYGFSAFFLVVAMKGGDLSALYPFIALGFIWVALLSWYFLGEVMHVMKWTGIAVIMLGLVFVGVGSK